MAPWSKKLAVGSRSSCGGRTGLWAAAAAVRVVAVLGSSGSGDPLFPVSLVSPLLVHHEYPAGWMPDADFPVAGGAKQFDET